MSSQINTTTMPQSRIIRQQTLQLICQYDAGNCDVASITEVGFNEDTSETMQPGSKSVLLAQNVWDLREKADDTISLLTPDWPIHRQPLVDRNILRLAYYEISTKSTPPIVAIDEAIELAKEFGTEESPAFINAVLEKIMQQCDASVKDSDSSTS